MTDDRPTCIPRSPSYIMSSALPSFVCFTALLTILCSPSLSVADNGTLAEMTDRSGGVSAKTDSSPDVLGSRCHRGFCRNGECYIRGAAALCYCRKLFKGARCEHVDLSHVTYSVVGSAVILEWPRPPAISAGYSFVYYELDRTDSAIYTRKITMADSDSAALVGSMKGGYTRYRVCVEDDRLANRVALEQSDAYRLTNCISVETKPDYHTMAAWCIAALLVCVIVVLIYWQKDKFELLYFSKPALLIFEAHEDEEGGGKTDGSESRRAESPSLAVVQPQTPSSATGRSSRGFLHSQSISVQPQQHSSKRQKQQKAHAAARPKAHKTATTSRPSLLTTHPTRFSTTTTTPRFSSISSSPIPRPLTIIPRPLTTSPRPLTTSPRSSSTTPLPRPSTVTVPKASTSSIESSATSSSSVFLRTEPMN